MISCADLKGRGQNLHFRFTKNRPPPANKIINYRSDPTISEKKKFWIRECICCLEIIEIYVVAEKQVFVNATTDRRRFRNLTDEREVHVPDLSTKYYGVQLICSY